MVGSSQTKKIFQETQEESTESIIIYGEDINNSRYADDTVIVTDNLQNFLNLLEHLNVKCKINFKKIKFMICRKNHNERLIVSKTYTENIRAYKYFGIWFTEKFDQNKEIRTHIETVEAAFSKAKNYSLSYADEECTLKWKLKSWRHFNADVIREFYDYFGSIILVT